MYVSVSLHVYFSWLFSHPVLFTKRDVFRMYIRMCFYTYAVFKKCWSSRWNVLNTPKVVSSTCSSLCCIITFFVLIYVCHTKFDFRKGISITAEPWYNGRYSVWVTGWTIRGASVGRGKIFFFSPECPHQPCHTKPVIQCVPGFFPGSKAA